MDQQMIILIISGVVSLIQTGSWVGIAVFLVKLISKKVEDSTGLKGELGKLNKKLAEVIEENEELKCRYDAFMLEMKGIKQYACKRIGENREAKE